jgi:hypothetical protein
MNRDDIIRMAREAEGIQFNYRPSEEFVCFAERFAALVAATELNRCVLILERLHERSGGQYNYYLHAAKVLKGEV